MVRMDSWASGAVSQSVKETRLLADAISQLEALEVQNRPDFGETLLFWKDYDSRPYVEKGLPAWHEDLQSPRAVARRRRRDWGTEAAAQRRLAARDVDLPLSSMSMDLEVQSRSKERLRRMLRTGQLARVKKEFEASLPRVREERRCAFREASRCLPRPSKLDMEAVAACSRHFGPRKAPNGA